MLEFVATLCPFLSSFVWQREAFDLRVVDGVICGSTAFGDNLCDEWFIVFLLVEISRTFPDSVIEVHDNDGELLLIEAAMALPEWVDPDTSDNRVFLFRGEVQLLGMPEEDQAEQPFAPLSVTRDEAVALVGKYGPSGVTRASDTVQACIMAKLSDMPQRALVENYHWCKLLVPREIAILLQRLPQLVAAGVESFYYREMEDDRKLRDLARFDTKSSVMVRVRFSRYLYAQLLQQTFPVPSPRFSLPPENDPTRKASELGMKLTCGFELMWNKQAGKEQVQDLLRKGTGTEIAGASTEPDSDDTWMLVSPSQIDDIMSPLETEAEQVKKMMEKVDGIKVEKKHGSCSCLIKVEKKKGISATRIFDGWSGSI
jgi:hypothetical protein